MKKCGYSVIKKVENYISFQKWSTLDAGRGVAYSIDGEVPKLEYLTKAEVIEGDNWYYYEEDFNVWKAQNIK